MAAVIVNSAASGLRRRQASGTRDHREEGGCHVAPACDGQADRRRDPQLVFDRDREGERDDPVAPAIDPGANAHGATVLRAGSARIIPGVGLGDRALALSGYMGAPEVHPAALPRIAAAADDSAVRPT